MRSGERHPPHVCSEVPGGLRLRVHVQPRSSRDEVVGLHGGAVKVRVKAPPIEGAANAALIELLGRWLDVPRQAVRIESGRGKHQKLVVIATERVAAVKARIDAVLAGV